MLVSFPVAAVDSLPDFCAVATFPPAVAFPSVTELIGATLAVAPPADGLRSFCGCFSFSSSDSEELTGEKMLFFFAFVDGAEEAAGLGPPPFFAIGGVILGGSLAPTPADLAAPFVIGADFG